MPTAHLANQALVNDVIEWRRYLHQNPELSYKEFNTHKFVKELLDSFGNMKISKPTKTSIIAKLEGDKPGKNIAFRADMDALPIQEEWESNFKSKNAGVMHACGHDSHTAMLLGAAKYLATYQKDLNGNIYFIFQHAEEMFPGGASEIIKTGILDNIDEIYGMHLFPTIKTGEVALSSGYVTANSDTFDIEIKGSGGHASEPHKTTDPIVMAVDIVSSFQNIISRKINPRDDVVLSVTEFHSGSAKNIIPSKVLLGGGVRSFGERTREVIKSYMEDVLDSHATLNGANYSFDFTYGYKAVYNDPHLTRKAHKAISENNVKFELIEMPDFMGGEDFSAYLEKIPGCFIGVGAAPQEDIFPLHHPKFNIDEKSLHIGLDTWLSIAGSHIITN